jgi:hypothetical protein
MIYYKSENKEIMNLEIGRIFQSEQRISKLISQNLDQILENFSELGFKFIVPQSRNTKTKNEIFFEEILKKLC